MPAASNMQKTPVSTRKTFQYTCTLALLGCWAGCAAPDPGPPQVGCADDDPRVGQSAVLETRFHSVSGTATIVDNCTIVIENFTYDGGGLDVRVYGAADTTFEDGVVLSEELRKAGGYDNETLAAGILSAMRKSSKIEAGTPGADA